MKTHLFGELDLDLSKSYNAIYKKAFDIGEACGYFADRNKSQTKIRISGSDNNVASIFFENGKVTKVTRAQYTDNGNILVPWAEVKIGSYIPPM